MCVCPGNSTSSGLLSDGALVHISPKPDSSKSQQTNRCDRVGILSPICSRCIEFFQDRVALRLELSDRKPTVVPVDMLREPILRERLALGARW